MNQFNQFDNSNLFISLPPPPPLPLPALPLPSTSSASALPPQATYLSEALFEAIQSWSKL